MDSSPEPDLAWVTKGRYAAQHPTAQQVHLLVEVSKSSKEFDCGEKMRLYAEAGIPEYWVVDVVAKTVDVMRDPAKNDYKIRRLFPIGESVVPLCLPGAQLQVSRLFG